MYVIVDKEYVFWWDESMRLQNFRGVTLYQPAGMQNMSHIIAMFDSGVGVEVMTYQGHLTVHVYVPETFLVGLSLQLILNLRGKCLTAYPRIPKKISRHGSHVKS